MRAHIRQLASESLIYSFFGLITRPSVSAAVLVPLFSRIFLPSDYGVLSLIAVISSFLSNLAAAGLENSSARWFYDNNDLSDQKTTISTWFWTQLTASLILMGLFFLLAPTLSSLIFGTGKYTIFFQLAAITLPFGTFIKVCGNWLLYQRKAWLRSIFNFAAFVITLGSTVGLTLIYKQLWAVFCAQLVAAFIIALYASWLLKDWVLLNFFSWPRLRSMLKFSFPLVPASIAYIVAASIDRFILKIFYDTSEVGIYTVALFLAGIVGLFSGGFQIAWGPFALSLDGSDSQRQKIYSKVFDLYAWSGCLFCTLFSLFAPGVLKFFATSQYLPAVSCIPFLAFSYLLLGTRDIATLGPTIAKTSIPIAKSLYMMAVLNVFLNILLIPRYGKEGAALANFFSVLISTIYLFAVSQKIHYISYNFWTASSCFFFSWILIAVDQFLFQGFSLTSFFGKISLILVFFLLGLRLKIIPAHYFKEFLFAPIKKS